jgi:flagellin
MSMTIINTNLSALTAQRNLQGTSGQLATALQRLSSGLRVNSSKDDAAGLSISERMTTQVRGLTQSIRNIADGVSLAQTAEGGLESITNNLQRIRELAIQSANFTNTSADRAALQLEASQLQEEVTRVANQTSFNGVKLLNGSFTSAVFQAGANIGETIEISNIADARASALGQFTGVNLSGVAVDANGPTAKSIQIGTTTSNFTSANTASAVASAINGLSLAGVAAYVDSDGKLGVSYIQQGGVTGNVTLTGVDTAPVVAAISASQGPTVGSANLGSVTGANQAIRAVDIALASLSSSRAKLGAAMNRFEASIEAQRIAVEAQTASRSRIRDADFAQETASLTRAQILQQSGVAILAQANTLPQNVLTLLR